MKIARQSSWLIGLGRAAKEVFEERRQERTGRAALTVRQVRYRPGSKLPMQDSRLTNTRGSSAFHDVTNVLALDNVVGANDADANPIIAGVS